MLLTRPWAGTKEKKHDNWRLPHLTLYPFRRTLSWLLELYVSCAAIGTSDSRNTVMTCPDPRHCPQLVNGTCKYLLGTSIKPTHSEIRRSCDRMGRIPEDVVADNEALMGDPEIRTPQPTCRNNGGLVNCGGPPHVRGRCALCDRRHQF